MRKLLLVAAAIAALVMCEKPEEEEGTGWISVSSTPSGADVYLNDVSTGRKTSCMLADVEPGDHKVSITFPGYSQYDEYVEVTGGDTVVVDATLSADHTVLRVLSEPQGAEILIDGVNTGEKTNKAFNGLSEGSHHILLILDGYYDWDTTVSLIKGDTVTVDAELKVDNGAISVNSTPTGADIYLDGEKTNKRTNSILTSLSVGEHTLRLVLTNHYDYTGTVEVKAGDTVTINVTLEDILLWQHVLPGSVRSSPAMADDGTIYVTSHSNSLHAINEQGNQLWSYPTEFLIESSPALGPDGTIYFGSMDNRLYAISSSGDFIWKYGTAGDVMATPAIGADGTVFVPVSHRRIVTEELVFYFNAFNPDSTTKWSYEIGEETYEVTNSPVIGTDGTVYFACEDKNLYALDSEGNLRWTHSLPDISKSTPAIGADGTLYFGCQDYKLYAVSSDGTLRWSFETGGAIESSPAIAEDGTVYSGSDDGYLYALDQSGNLDWAYEVGRAVKCAPAVGNDGVIYFGAVFGGVYALSLEGEIKWMYETEGSVRSSPVIGDNVVYVCCDDGILYALKCSSSGLAPSAWPRFHHDNANTGRAR